MKRNLLRLVITILLASLVVTSQPPIPGRSVVCARFVYAVGDIQGRYLGIASKLYLPEGEMLGRLFFRAKDPEGIVRDWAGENLCYALFAFPLFVVFLRREKRRKKIDDGPGTIMENWSAIKKAAVLSVLIPGGFILFNLQTLLYEVIPK